MKPSQLSDFLHFAINNKMPILIKGKPGIGKSDIVSQACAKANAHLIISHPVVSDPTDYKGMPFISKDGNSAHFMPFGELVQLIEAKEPTVFFLDDLGQAPASVQAAVMQLLLSRRINGHQVSEYVSFVAATNRREDKAGVQGILEPVKSRFASIVELEVDHTDWVKWAIQNDMPIELIGFVKFRPKYLEAWEPSKDITNTPSPRTITYIGRMQNAGLNDNLNEVFTGAAGSAFASEYVGFLKVFQNLPNIDNIILSPDTVKVPTQPDVLYALSSALGARINKDNAGAIIKYLNRIDAQEFAVATIKDAIIRDESVTQCKAMVNWMADKSNVIL